MQIRKKFILKLAWVLFTVFMITSCGSGGGGGGDNGGGNNNTNTGDTAIPATTKVLDDSTMQSLSSISQDGTTITFSQSTTMLQSLSPGDVVVNGVSNQTPNGLIRKVTSVQQNGEQIVVETTAATIEDAVQKGKIEVNSALTQNNIVSATGLMKGVSFKPTSLQAQSLEEFYIAIEDVVLYDNDGDEETTNDQITANGSVSLNPSYSFSMAINDFRLEQLTFTNTTVETAEIKVNCKVSGSIVDLLNGLRNAGRLPSWIIITNTGAKVELARYKFSPFTVWVGYVPVVITPILTVNVGLDGKVSVGITSSVTQQATLTAGLSYNNSHWSPISDFSNDLQFLPPSLSAGALFKAYAGPELKLMLYGVVGPTGAINGYLELDADLLVDPWWILYGGIYADIGIEVEILSHVVAGYHATVIDYKKILAQAETPPNLVKNGGFETPDVGTGDGTHGVGNSIYTSIPYWTSTGDVELQVAPPFRTPYEGSQMIELDSWSNITISQSITTQPTKTYTLSFAFAGRGGSVNPIGSNGLNVFWGSTQLNTSTLYADPNTGWKVYTFSGLTPTGNSTLLQFQGAGTSDGLGSYLDGVSVTAD